MNRRKRVSRWPAFFAEKTSWWWDSFWLSRELMQNGWEYCRDNGSESFGVRQRQRECLKVAGDGNVEFREKMEGSGPPFVNPYFDRLNVSMAISDGLSVFLKISWISSADMTTPSLNPSGYSTVSMFFPSRPKTPAKSLVTVLPFIT
jgi:hypothetical protein